MPEPTPTPVVDPQPTGTATQESSTAVTTPDPASTPTEPPKSDPWDDPTAAKAEIERLRRENAKDRTNAKAQAAEDARKDLAQTIGKALGIVEDGAETDPAKLTESLTASQAEAKQARVELAVFRNAHPAGSDPIGDPIALLDSKSFLKSLAAIDPADSAAVTEAIKAAVEANPRLGAAPGDPKAPAPNPAQGASASGAAVGALDAQIAAAEKARDFQTAIALKQRRAAELRTQKP